MFTTRRKLEAVTRGDLSIYPRVFAHEHSIARAVMASVWSRSWPPKEPAYFRSTFPAAEIAPATLETELGITGSLA